MRYLLRYLRERNGNIQEVTFHSGAPLPDFAMLFGTRFDREPSWAMHNSVSFVCNMVYNGESPEQRGWLRVSCPDLNTGMNAQLHQLAQRAGRVPLDPKKLDADGLRLRVALDGPLDAVEWEAWKDEQQRQRDKTRQEKQTTALQRFVVGPFKRAWKR